jgi:hypothetical protein
MTTYDDSWSNRRDMLTRGLVGSHNDAYLRSATFKAEVDYMALMLMKQFDLLAVDAHRDILFSHDEISRVSRKMPTPDEIEVILDESAYWISSPGQGDGL